MNAVRKLLVSLFLLGALAACGQSGPLYLPGNPSEVQNPPSQVPEPPQQAVEDDDDEEDADDDGGT